MTTTVRPRILELYAGIGGAATAAKGWADVVAAIEQSPVAAAGYERLHGRSVLCRNLEGLSPEALGAFDADLWWMSPPCQPFTKRGHQRDLADPRTASFVKIVDAISVVHPAGVVLENVPEFAGSMAHARLTETLEAAGYTWWQGIVCPTELGIPGRRRRFYLAASRSGPSPAPTWESRPARLSEYILEEPTPMTALYPSPDVLARYKTPISIVDPTDPSAVAECFTAGYGRHIVFTGSLLRTRHGIRRFSPSEILHLLGFGPQADLGPEIDLEAAYRLVGNSLSVPVVRGILSAFFRATQKSCRG